MLSEKFFFRLLHAAGISSLKPTSPCAARTQFRSKLRFGGVYWTQLELTFCRETIPTPFPAAGIGALIKLRCYSARCRCSSQRSDPRLRSVCPITRGKPPSHFADAKDGFTHNSLKFLKIFKTFPSVSRIRLLRVTNDALCRRPPIDCLRR